MVVLGIETSCDETAAAVVADGRRVLSNVVYSQVPLHQPYGGVVPEIASRSHVEKLPGVVAEAVRAAFAPESPAGSAPPPAAWREVDAVAVTYGPGLASSLIVGLSAAKGLALRLERPLIGMNHIEAHIHSVFLNPEAPDPREAAPLLALVVSGGHSCWIETDRPGNYRMIGQTLDDAAGEAFDKAAKLLGLGYPGGPEIDRLARQAARVDAVAFPKGSPRPGNPALAGLRAELCVSFSGLKTALLYHLRSHPPQDQNEVAEVAAAYQEAIVTALAERSERALRGGRYAAFAVGGGVSLNRRLRERLTEVARAAGVRLLLAEPRFCGDNAAMIAGLAGAGGGVRGPAAQELDASPALAAGEEGTAW
ncbi:MAG TPA: tRNA (adenosine(37)-N6)-threonylcarbamoyltransferase complex transferase subunit TsaD [Kiritimatiellia bacterium]|jgi:N6-L-threonylcarbamoyladenine synthase|nr:tRNA (adenosine(37)-N6)-threonylcarbamoyltransferase complex transferase subunit TsaD [Kiritimatiellia bacterium]HOM59593.1 tRNA (adenosine(37)-N6)-threonylcarbamoyltransferase complex transferase subunit TsaD [Kiritimatiellia bacterium]HOR97357.1 tRNA (adenosine(37)-N6)-threonylcarbamoyltransferase complex transferase subunit TsaD [Kiritimatiellia bacterium]HPC48849.1 tRNA (adenosine(37)-N6)-threonylcarbamoyltransferase complex transferase subunit TsaD [Kiritimatiellia bacterium]HPW74398.1 